MSATPLRLSPSQVNRWLGCGRSHQYSHVWKFSTLTTAANLVFGRVSDTVISEALILHAKGLDPGNLGDNFVKRWEGEKARVDLAFTNKKVGAAEMLAMGRDLANAFMPAWKASGLTVATLPDGEPAVQLALEADLGRNVRYKGILDILAFDREGDLGIVDVKTASAAAMEGFEQVSDQLADYQMVAEAEPNAAMLGISPGDIRWLRFIELMKKTTTSVNIRPPAPRRSEASIAERLADIHWVAAAIRAGHHPRRSGTAFSSPCRICDYALHCRTGDAKGLFIRKSRDEERGAPDFPAVAARSVAHVAA